MPREEWTEDEKALFRGLEGEARRAGDTIPPGGWTRPPPFVPAPMEPAFPMMPPWSPYYQRGAERKGSPSGVEVSARSAAPTARSGALGPAKPGAPWQAPGTPGWMPPKLPPPPAEEQIAKEWRGEGKPSPQWARELAAEQPRARAPYVEAGPQGFTPRAALASRPAMALRYAPVAEELGAAAQAAEEVAGRRLLTPLAVGALAAAPVAALGYAAYRSNDPDESIVQGLESLASRETGRGKILDMEDVDQAARDWLRANPSRARELANRGIIGADLLLHAYGVEPVKGVWPSGWTTPARKAEPMWTTWPGELLEGEWPW